VDDVIYVLQNKTYVYQVGHNNLIYIMMHGQRNIKINLCPKLNGYGDNGQRKVWSSLGFHSLFLTADSVIVVESLSVVSCYADSSHASCTLHMYFLQGDVSAEQSCVIYSAWNPKDNYGMSASVKLWI
jgi:hypothetical protein